MKALFEYQLRPSRSIVLCSESHSPDHYFHYQNCPFELRQTKDQCLFLRGHQGLGSAGTEIDRLMGQSLL